MTNTIFILDETHHYFNAQGKSMIKPLALSDIYDLCRTLDIAVDQGDYSKVMVESMYLDKLCALVNLGISRALATSTLPTCWSYKVESFPNTVSMDGLIKFINNLTGADLVQVIHKGGTYDDSYVIYRLPII